MIKGNAKAIAISLHMRLRDELKKIFKFTLKVRSPGIRQYYFIIL